MQSWRTVARSEGYGEVLILGGLLPEPESLLAYSIFRLIRQGAPHEGLTLGHHASIAVFVLVA
jgi:hypothetical protein